MRRVIVLRPEPGASETVRRARQLGLEAAAIPLFKVEPIAWTAPDPAQFDALLLTSANAVRHGGEHLAAVRSLCVHAVGRATADAARTAGFTIANAGETNVDGLLASIDPGLRLLHLCGQQRQEPGDTRAAITSIPVYRARPLPEPQALLNANAAVVLVHSPRAAQRLAEFGLDRPSICIAAISSAAADAVGGGWGAVEVAAKPSDDALLALAKRLCNKPERP